MLRGATLCSAVLVLAVAFQQTTPVHAADVCVQACLAPYANDPSSSTTIKSTCRQACKVAARQQRQCLKTENQYWRAQLKTCKKSLRGIKRGADPLTYDLTLTTTLNNTEVPTTWTFFYDSGCVETIKTYWSDAKRTCREILCAEDEYWNIPAKGCVANPNQDLPTTGANGAPLPATIRGFYKFEWLRTAPYQGPADTNVGVTFTGTFPGDRRADIDHPITNAPLNFIGYGGGTRPDGTWSKQRLLDVAAKLTDVVDWKYDGVVIDAEESSEVITVAEWNTLFQAIKAKNLILVVTISHFRPYGMEPNANDLVSDWLTNPLIDYLSPQLYTSGMEAQNDWAGYNPAFKTSVPRMAPSIVQAYYYDQLGANSVTTPDHLPNSQGYFVWRYVG